ncbi:Structural maintenance of chromosomes protein 6 [Acromyrmex echinatior]|uniref:Structural maintenance of chromosomes protein 6 n=1 Tax=Acromyrmex echinatior TaxID=103372 RepID=F4WXD6_ACREC|nr:Structural maintenance of chromosomes protein 6 [Acromyrmex echinatior]
MENDAKRTRRRKTTEKSYEHQAKRSKQIEDDAVQNEEYTAGKVKKIRLHNFMCHDALEITLNENVNFIVGQNGSGKSAILTALTVGLGARANVTSRGTSVKEFVKKGRNSAIIEITLVNKGDTAYKPEVYGNIITVLRNIGTTSSYKIKNWRGEIISTKRDELDNIISMMNIQIDNPISVLNQDVSRTFLVTSKPEEKYSLFMKATLLDSIEINYKEALNICEEEYDKLQQYNATLSQEKKQIEKLKESIHRLEEMDESRAELSNLEMELHWATAIVEETKLNKIQNTVKMHEDKLKELQNIELSTEKKDEGIDKNIEEIKQKIQQAEQEAIDSNEAYNSSKQKHKIANEAYLSKQREWRSVSSKIKRLEDDANLVKKEIQKLESCNDEEYNKKKEMKERLSKLEEKLDELDASLRTKQTELMHLEADRMRLQQDVTSAKNEIDNFDRHIQKIKKDLSAVEQQSDNALSVFGPNVPRLLKRIEEEYKKNRFKKKPRGPIGAFIKLKDAAWAPAVESFLGFGTLNSFCVDNSQDAKLLNSIMKEIFYNENTLQVICSKFFNQVHDVRHHCTYSPQYSNLLEAMVIEDPVVANSLIDQREIECILLIPTNEEACAIMSDGTKVPKNCKRAFTLHGDTFFPDPNYRTYGGNCTRAKYLQVSTMEAMQTLKEELQIAENKKQDVTIAYNTVREKLNRTNSELTNVSITVRKLRSAQSECTNLINELKDKIESTEGTSVDVFRHEAAEIEKKVAHESAAEKLLAENVQELQKNVESLDMEGIRQAIQCATGEFEIQERVTKKAISVAITKCPRIDTTRSINQIKTLLSDLQDKIREIENQFGCADELRLELAEKQEKYGVHIEFSSQLKKSFEKHIERVKHRQKMFLQLRDTYSVYVQKSFTDVLSLRQYKGTVVIDHQKKVLDLHVSARNDQKSGNDTRSLSGGERSYSTVAFILALWDCIQLPFYFLDEFDVFMDKVNRRVIMDILLEHTRLHPQSQFAFLTPLDTSHILAEDYVTIHHIIPKWWSGHSSVEVGSGGGVGEGGGRGDLGDRCGIGEGSVSYGGGDLRNRGSVGQRSRGQRGVGHRGGDLGDRGSIGEGCGDRGDSLDSNGGGFLADYGVESIDWVSSVFDDAPGAIGFQEGVATLDEVAITGLLLGLVIASQAVVHIVRIAVLWVRVEVCVNGLGNGGGYNRGSRSIGQRGTRRNNTGVGGGDQGGESDKLEEKT